MNDKETIIELAHTTLDRMAPDDYCREPYWTATDDELVRFAMLVAEHVREACAKLCVEHWRNGGSAMECADAILAGG